MSNHFHLLVYQIDQQAMAHLMRPLLTSFSMYFNKKYERSGPLFETRYRASRISSDSYLVHITRYIHLNPEKWQTYRHSSLSMYTGKRGEDWVDPSPILKLFSSKTEYLEFLKNYKEERAVLDKLKHELADL